MELPEGFGRERNLRRVDPCCIMFLLILPPNEVLLNAFVVKLNASGSQNFENFVAEIGLREFVVSVVRVGERRRTPARATAEGL